MRPIFIARCRIHAHYEAVKVMSSGQVMTIARCIELWPPDDETI